MIKYIKHKQIDKQKWDVAVENSTQPLVYALSWYLDIVSPEWEALVDDDYQTIMPLTKGPKFGIRYLRQPFLCQQLGVFSVNELSSDIVDKFLRHIPAKYKLADIKLNSKNIVPDNPKYVCTPMPNYLLDLNKDYELLRNNYSTNTKRNIAKAHKNGLIIKYGIDNEDLVNLKINNPVNDLKKNHFDTMRLLTNTASDKNKGYSIGVFSKNGELLSACYIIDCFDRYTFLVSVNSNEGKKKRAMFFLLDNFFKENCNNNRFFDFEGSAIPELARFFQSFGSVTEFYTHFYFNRLPIILKRFKK
jgi:hypothetical protein